MYFSVRPIFYQFETRFSLIHYYNDDVIYGLIHRPAFKPASTLGVTVIFYFALVFFGIIGNLIILGIIIRRKLYKMDNSHACVFNLIIAFLIQLVIVIPLTLFAIVVHNWVLGTFMCYTMPIIQVRSESHRMGQILRLFSLF